MISRLNLYDANGDKINMESIGLFGLKLRIPAPSYTIVKETLDDGSTIILDKQLNPRQLVAEFMSKGIDYKDSLLLRDDLFRLLGNGEEMYVGESFLSGKRWKVHFEDWEPERVSRRVSKVDIPLFCASGLSESVGTSLDELTFEIEKWQTGQGLTVEEPTYVHQTNSFKIFNVGDVPVDPRKRDLKIIFKGASTNLKITNNTTGEVWQYTGSSTVNDTITLDGVRSFKNGASIFGQTNKKLISLLPGWNDFTITGASGSFLITFDFRFYYL
ncbi:MAG: phage tail domain-containing protein [Psychrobacillus psychrodurans]